MIFDIQGGLERKRVSESVRGERELVVSRSHLSARERWQGDNSQEELFK
jgi:hypothetical protein